MATAFDDIIVMKQIAAQDQRAFQLLYREYGTAVYSLAYRILQNGTLAEEVTQDTFLKVWQQKASWDPGQRQAQKLAADYFPFHSSRSHPAGTPSTQRLAGLD